MTTPTKHPRSDTRFRLLFERNPLPMWVFDADTLSFLEVNDAAVERYGYTRDEFLAMRITDIRPEEDVPRLVRALRGVVRDFESEQWRHRLKDGRVIDVLVVGQDLAYEGRRARLVVAHDVTDQRRAQETIRQREAELRSLIAHMPAVVWSVDRDLRFTSSIGAGLEGLGLDPGKLVGMTLFDYFGPQADDRAPLDAHVRALRGERARYEVSWAGRTFATSVEPVRDDDGSIVGAVGIAVDITERKEREERERVEASRSEALAEISRTLAASSPDYERGLRSVAAQTSLLADGLCIIALLTRGGTRLEPVAVEHRDPAIVSFVRELMAHDLDPTDALLAGPIEEGKPLFIPTISREDVAPFTAAFPDALLHDLGAVLIVPLRAQGATIGLMSIARPRTRPFALDEQVFVQDLADRVSLGISAARSFRQTERRLEQVQALHTMGLANAATLDLRATLEILLDQVMGRLRSDAAAVWLMETGGLDLALSSARGFQGASSEDRIRVGEGLIGRAARDRKTLVVPDLGAEPDAGRSPAEREGFVGYCAVPLIAKGELKGVLEVLQRAPLHLEPENRGFIEALAAQAAVAINNAELFDDLRRTNADLAVAYDATLEGWSAMLDLRDRETEGHSQRVAEVSVALARALGVPADALVHVRRGAVLHDIGKMAVPDSVLLKPGSLTGDEWALMRSHPLTAYRFLSAIPYLRPALEIPYCHHERWDGSGYPRRLRRDNIPYSARLFAVVDVWDALRSDRPYRRAWAEAEAREYLRSNAGVLFDPEVVEAFFDLKGRAA